MKLKKFLKLIDSIGINVVVWTQDSTEEDGPAYEGDIFDIPWWLMECRIGRANDDLEEPIYIYTQKNEHDVLIPTIVINVIE